MAKEREDPEVVEEERPPRLGAGEGDEVDLPEGWEAPEGVDISKLLVGGGEDEDIPEEFRGKSKKELAALLKAQAEAPKTDGSLGEGLTKLSEAILKQRRLEEPVGAVPEQKPGESDEDFWKRAATALFDDKEIKATFSQAMDRNPRMLRLAVQNMENKKELLQIRNPDVWKAYEEEIETEAKALLKQYGPDGEIYKVAFGNVRARHVDEIVGGSKDKEILDLRARVAELESGSGSGNGVEGAARHPRPRSVSGGSGLPAGGAGGGKKRIVITPELREKALRKGMTVEAYLGIE